MVVGSRRPSTRSHGS